MDEIREFLQAEDHVTEAAMVRLRAGDLTSLTEGLRRVKQLTRSEWREARSSQRETFNCIRIYLLFYLNISLSQHETVLTPFFF